MAKSKRIDYVHTGPETAAGRFLRSFWQPVHVAAELETGKPKRIKVLGEYFTLYRGEDGIARLVEDTCPHRRTQLYLGWVEGDSIRCFYHGWKFNGVGQCTEQPGEGGAFARKIKIASYPTREYLGLIFAFLGEGEAPELPRYPELENEAHGRILARSIDLPFNYFQRLENDHDTVHIHFVHKAGMERVGVTDVPTIHAKETEYGFWQGAERADGSVRASYCFMPNALMTMVSLGGGAEDYTAHLAWRVPIDDGTCCSYTVNRLARAREGSRGGLNAAVSARTHAERILAGQARVQELDPALPYAFVVQDYVVLSAQGVIADRADEHLGKSDAGIIMLRRLYEREIKKIADGKAPKRWWRSDERLPFSTSISK